MVKKKDILLVNPACLDDRISGEDARVVPIGLYYIAAQLLDSGFSVEILNLAELDEKSRMPSFVRAVEQQGPSTIGFSVTNPNRWNAIECAGAAKKISPSTAVVFGGPAPTFMAEHLFEACPQIDYIVSGEGEITFLELAEFIVSGEDAEEPDQINGLVYKKEKKLVQTPPREPVAELDSLARPSAYFTFQHLAMSRGCPGKCTFCGSPRFWNHPQVRFHSPEWFAREIETLFKKGVTHFYISDDTFTMDKSRVIEFCRLLTEKQLPATWNAISRADYIDEEILKAMRTAGCIQISFGIESGSKKIRKALGKPMNPEKIFRAFSLTRTYGILPRAYFIYGSPGETKETIKESRDMLKQVQPLSAIFYMLVILPGTHLYRSAVQKGRLSEDVWHQKIEDVPWFEVDDDLDFETVKAFGDALRDEFYSGLDAFARNIELVGDKTLYPFHADFLSRLGLTFSHGEYASDPRVTHQEETAAFLFEKALDYAPDARAFMGLAMIFQKNRQAEKSVRILENALEFFPDHPDLNICMGVGLMNLKKFTAALNIFNRFASYPGIENYINICRQQA